MPGAKQALEDVVLPAVSPGQFVISAEHASNRIPARYKNLSLSKRQIRSHIAWDPGTREIARALAKALGCACHEGSYSRLLVDLNRSVGHPKLMARRSFSIDIPGNSSIPREEAERRIQLYYRPFREAVHGDVQQVIEKHGRCLHLSIHSFTPVAGEVVRNADIGLLYDPHRPVERRVSSKLFRQLTEGGWHVRRNYPYRGVSDGHTTHLRRVFAGSSYAGLEIEVNQRLLRSQRGIRQIAGRLLMAVRSLTEEP
jgi:predicted N-formylglutamate amidohydrolase